MLVVEQEQKRAVMGLPPRDLSAYTGWRDEASPANLDLIDFYLRFLPGQFSGMTNALSLEAVKTALEIDDVPRQEWPDMTERLIRLHNLVEQHRPKKES